MPAGVLLIINVLFHYVTIQNIFTVSRLLQKLGSRGCLQDTSEADPRPDMINGEKPVDRRLTDFHKTLQIRIAEFAGIRYDDTG